jgi:hypothetical protein
VEENHTCMKVDKTYFEISSKAFPKLSVKLLFPSQTSSMEEIEMINLKLIFFLLRTGFFLITFECKNLR